jgi:hypothetical protein
LVDCIERFIFNSIKQQFYLLLPFSSTAAFAFPLLLQRQKWGNEKSKG